MSIGGDFAREELAKELATFISEKIEESPDEETRNALKRVGLKVLSFVDTHTPEWVREFRQKFEL